MFQNGCGLQNLFLQTEVIVLSNDGTCPLHPRKKKDWLTIQLVADLDAIYMVLVGACRMEELWSQEDFHPDFRRNTGKPRILPLKEQCAKLWVWSQTCSIDPRVLDKPETWIVWEKIQGKRKTGLREREAIKATITGSTTRMDIPKHLEFTFWHGLLQILEMEVWDIMFSLLDYSIILIHIFLPLYLYLYKWECLSCSIVPLNLGRTRSRMLWFVSKWPHKASYGHTCSFWRWMYLGYLNVDKGCAGRIRNVK